jgi:WD40 repeat protein
MQVWDLKAEKLVVSVQTMAPAHAVAWSAYGKTVAAGSEDRALRFWEAATGRLKATLVAEDGQVVAVSAEGHFRAVPGVDSELVYVVLTDKGQETYEPRAFAAKYPWRNNPAAVRLTGN